MSDLPPWRKPEDRDSEPCGPAVEVHGIRQDCEMGVWDNAFLRAEEDLDLNGFDRQECFALGADWGAGWGAAIVGMAQAIRDRPKPYAPRCSCDPSVDLRGYDPFCTYHGDEEIPDPEPFV